MVLKGAELGGLGIPDVHRELIVAFSGTVTSGNQGGLASYRPGETGFAHHDGRSVWSAARFLGLERRKSGWRRGRGLFAGRVARHEPDQLYYWYYATLSLYQVQGTAWQRWNEALTGELLATQHRDGKLAGTWDPDAVWGGYGGRVYSTALSALCLEVYYRYLPLYIEAARDGRKK